MNSSLVKEATKRFDYIDLLKSIAILFVIIYHNECYNPSFIANEDNIFITSIRAILATCVPLFFLVNGYLLFSKEFDLKKHTIKTIKLILITIIWGIITAFLILKIKNDSITVQVFFDTLLKMREGYVNHLWFMGALICIYLIFPVLKNVFDTNKKIFIWFVFICAIFTFGNKFLNAIWTIIGYSNGNLNYVTNLNFFHMFNPLRGIFGYTIVYFCIGGLLFEYMAKIKQIRKRYLYSLIGIFISSIGLAYYGMFCSKVQGKTWDFVWNGYDTIFTFFNTLAIFILCLNYKTKNKIVKKVIYWISSNTLGIYILHMIFMQLTLGYVKYIPFLCNSFGNIIYALIVMTISLIGTIIIKKIPLIKKILLY